MTFEQIQLFFEVTDLPPGPIQLNRWSQIIDPQKFVASHLSIVKHNPGKRMAEPYKARLIEFINHLNQ